MAISEKPGGKTGESIISEGNELELFARSLGAEIYGVASAEAYSAEFPQKPQPDRYVPGAKSIIIIGLPQSPELWATVAKPQLAAVSRKASDEASYTVSGSKRTPMGAERFFINPEQTMLTNELLKMAYRIAWKLNREDYKAFYFHPFKPEPRFKTAAFYFMPAMYLAGIGQMGLNCSIITREYGPRIWVTAIITDKELPAGQPVGPVQYEDCAGCGICVERCPSHSLDGKGWKNVHGCASYGCCGTCLSVCPVGMK
ncbi:MAG TPA: epoxyqueuosine reductase [Dehalococcoidia bacterium]|nr:epoxyqueuosine reductase [Dehalococcoidia bacterium]